MPAARPAPSVALAVAAVAAPLAATLQAKVMAPLALVALLAAVALYRWREGRWPWPARNAVLAAGLALAGWAALSALWAPSPWRAWHAGFSLGGLLLLGAAGARVARDATEAERRRLLWCLGAGLALGLPLALLDAYSGGLVRALARGRTTLPVELTHNLKPAVSVMALLLPLLAGLPLPRPWRLAALAAGLALLLPLPGETARLGALLALALLAGVAWLGPRLARGFAVGAALFCLALPPLLPWALPRAGADSLPLSAAHRLLIWDFASGVAAQHPLLGIGAEGARTVPGASQALTPAALDRLGIHRPVLRQPLEVAQNMPLHPHSVPLQWRLELGWLGLLLGAALVLALGLAAARCAAPGVATGMAGVALLTGLLGFGAWQEWWLASQALAAALLGALPAAPRRG